MLVCMYVQILMSVQLLFHRVTSFVQIDQDPISVVVSMDLSYLMATDAEVSKLAAYIIISYNTSIYCVFVCVHLYRY